MKQHHRHDPYSKEDMLALTLSVSLYCAQIASSPSADANTRLNNPVEQDGANNAATRVAIKEAIVVLGDLSELVAEAGHRMHSNMPPRHSIDDEPFFDIANALRKLESLLDSAAALYVNAPNVADELRVLRRNLALTRSRTAQNSTILRQMLHEPEIYESSIDMKGLEDLASLSTARLRQLVN